MSGVAHPRGAVEFSAGGKMRVLRLAANEICGLEQRFDCGIQELAGMLQDGGKLRLSQIRCVFAFGLSDGGKPMNDEDAGEIMNEIGIETASQLIGEAFAAAFPAPATAKGGGGGAGQNPTKATGG